MAGEWGEASRAGLPSTGLNSRSDHQWLATDPDMAAKARLQVMGMVERFIFC
jgi:hypothetical protein